MSGKFVSGRGVRTLLNATPWITIIVNDINVLEIK